MAFKTDQIKLKEDYADNTAAGTPDDGTLALIGASGSRELKIRDGGAWVAISGGGGGAVSNLLDLGDVASSPSVQDTVGVVNVDGHLTFAKLNVNNIDSSSLNTSTQWDNNDTTLATTAAIQTWVATWATGQGYLTSETSHADVLVDGDFSSPGIMTTDGAGTYGVVTNNFLTSETFTEVSQDSTPVLGGDLFTDGNKIAHADGGASSELTFTHTWNGETNHTHLASVKSIDLYLDQNRGDTGQAIRVYNDLNPNVDAPDDTNYIWKLHESGTVYMTNDIDMGTNVITDAKVAQWDASWGWGDHRDQNLSWVETSQLNANVVFTTQTNQKYVMMGDPNGYAFLFASAASGYTDGTMIELINHSDYDQVISTGSSLPMYLTNTQTQSTNDITIEKGQRALIMPKPVNNVFFVSILVA